jgi:DNA invertase Pin-like site-specific DNA recombinase
MPTTVIGYVRVSSDEQAASGLSLVAQAERIRAYCAAREWTLAGIVTDAGESARTLDRPGMAKVREVMAERLVDGVVAVKLDRLTRSVRDLHTLLQLSGDTGVALVSVSESMDTSNAAGRLMLNMLGAIAEWEREVIAERTVAALAVKRARGERVSRYAPMGAGERGEHEREAMAEVERMLEAGTPSLRSIAATLAEHGYRNRAGERYHPSAVKRMVDRIVAKRPELKRGTEAAALSSRLSRLAEMLEVAA